MKNFEEMKMKEIIEIDVENVAKEVLLPNKEALNYDKDACAWFIRGEEVVDLLWYDCYTILHPKEIIGYIDEYIEDINLAIEYDGQQHFFYTLMLLEN